MIRMHRNSLFAVLLRKPWWLSVLIGLGIGLAAAALAPADWRGVALMTGLPFLVVGGIALVRGRGRPDAAEVERTAQAARALGWPAFAEQLHEAFARDGWAVQRVEAPSHDFVLERGGRRMLVAARRWKSAHLGLEPLRALQAARQAQDVSDALCIALGGPSAPARRYADEQRIALWQAAELAQALRRRRGA
ncbi:MAG: restriction endonuclease [Rubrivivax sp.]